MSAAGGAIEFCTSGLFLKKGCDSLNKVFKNRVFIVFLCSVIAIGCVYLYARSVKSEAEQTTVVRVVSNISKGDTITDKVIETVTVGGYNLAPNVIKSKDDVVGKYATADFQKGDYILSSKVSTESPSTADRLTQLDGNKVAFSITVKDFSDGLSNKLLTGDIVSVIVTEKEKTILPAELTYVEVLAATTSKGTDKTEQSTGEENSDSVKTVTLLVTPAQALQLAGYEDNAEIHLALVYRGDEQTAQKFITKQSEVFNNGKSDSGNR